MTGPEEVRGGDQPAVVTPPQVTMTLRGRGPRGRPLAARPRPRIDPNRLRVDPRRSRANRCGASFGMESVPHELLFEPLGQCPRSASPSSRLGCLVGSRAQPDDKGRAVEFPAPLESTEPRRPVHDGTSEGEPVPPLSSSGARARRRRSDHLGRQPTAGGARPAGRLTSGSTPVLLSTRPRQGRGRRTAWTTGGLRPGLRRAAAPASSPVWHPPIRAARDYRAHHGPPRAELRQEHGTTLPPAMGPPRHQ